MLYLPGIFGETLMDDWMDDFDRNMKAIDREFNDAYGRKNPLYGKHAKNLMKTDVREHDDRFEVDVDLPGFKKEDINLTLNSGYLTISASKGLDKEEKDEKSGRIVRQERYAGALTRSFYVGDELTEEDIKAKLEDGVLMITLPKKEKKPEIEQNKTIMIEG